MPTAIRFITRIQDTDDWANLDAVQFVSMAATGFLTNERVLIGTANQVIVTDGGAGGNVTLSTPQDIHIGATPQFARLGIGRANSGVYVVEIGGADKYLGFNAEGDMTFVDAAGSGNIIGPAGGLMHVQAGAGMGVQFTGHNNSTFQTDAGRMDFKAQWTCNFYTGGVQKAIIDNSGQLGVGAAAPATLTELEQTLTLAAATADGYAAALTLDPGYTAAHTVTRHNYIDVQDVSVAGGAAVTNSAVMRFDANIGTHKALAVAFTTTDSNGDTTNWATGVLININGVLYKLPAIAA